MPTYATGFLAYSLFVEDAHTGILSLLEYPFARASATISSQCLGRDAHCTSFELTKSAIVSVAPEKVGGDSVQPIVFIKGKATSWG